MNALEIKDLTKTFGDFKLDGLSLTLPGGCVMGLIGENGAGKTTVIKLILEILHRDGGSVRVLGSDGVSDVKEDVGVVLDEVGIPDGLNVRQVGKIMALTFKNWDAAGYDRLIKRFELPEKKPFKDFSKGMRMKLGFAVALSHGARLLLLDEATSGLDPVARDEALELLRDFVCDDRHAVLISSHIVSDLEKVCDYIAFLHKGRLMLCEEKDRLLEEYCVVHAPAEELEKIGGLIHKKITPYGAEALARRGSVSPGVNVSPVSIEELFVLMAKGEN